MSDKQIINPWIIVHQPGGEKTGLVTILAGRPKADFREFALVIADVVGHVSKAFNQPPEVVLEWVQREIERPTTELGGGKLQ